MRELDVFPGGIPRQEDLRWFHTLCRTIANRYDLQLQLQLLFSRFGAGLGRLSLIRLDERTRTPYFVYTHGFTAEEGEALLEDRAAIRWAEERRKVYLASQHADASPNYAAVIPLQLGGDLLGLLALHDRVPDDWGHVACLAQGLVMVLEIRRAQDTQEYYATHDDATGLHNQAYFQEALAAEIAKVARRPEEPLTIAILDIAGFSQIGETMGQKVSSAVVRQVAEVIREVTRASDHKCRLMKEDEFGIIMPFTETHHAVAVVERIQQTLARRMLRYRGSPLRVSLRAGIATYRAGLSRRDFVTLARQALQRAKEDGLPYFTADRLAQK